MHEKVLSTSSRSGETQRLTSWDLIHSLTTKSGRQVAHISISPSTNQNTCHTKVKGGTLPGIVLIKHFSGNFIHECVYLHVSCLCVF